MKPENPQDSVLDRTLREWRQNASLAPRFNERVWQRIARAETARADNLWMRSLAWASLVLRRPSLAVVYMSALLVAGLLGGYWHARHDNAQAYDELSSRYVRMMDPYQMPRN